MKRSIQSLVPLLFLFCSTFVLIPDLRAADVGVGYWELSPQTVFIKVGEVVYWDDLDEFGPYMITGPWGTLYTPNGLKFLAQGNYSYSAESVFGGGRWNGMVVVGANAPPTVNITNPTNGAVFNAPATFAFEAEAFDPDPNDLWDVEFWVDDEMVDDIWFPPYATTVTNLPAGTHTLKAIAWDFSYETATNTITINVVDKPVHLQVTGANATQFVFEATGLSPGRNHVLQSSTNLASAANWVSVRTNVSTGTAVSFTNALTAGPHFFRVLQLPP